jgi:hypothetical protein
VTMTTTSPSGNDETILAESTTTSSGHSPASASTDNCITTMSSNTMENNTNINKGHDILCSAENSAALVDVGVGVAPLSNAHDMEIDDANDGNSAIHNNNGMANGECSHNGFDASTNVAITTNDKDKAHDKSEVVDTPTRRNSRQVKKRREDGFFYAQDDKKEGTTTGMVVEDKTMKTTPNSELDTTQNMQKLHVSIDASANDSTTNPPPSQPTSKQRKRRTSQKCPINDTILIQIPLSVTADLGVAMKRTRKKRIKRIKRWLRTATMQGDCGGDQHQGRSGSGGVDSTTTATSSLSATKLNDSIANGKSKMGNGLGNGRQDKHDGDVDGGEGASDNDDDDIDDDDDDGTMNKNKYSSIVDYLEAKYVRGVMIDDYDEKITRKLKKKSNVKASAKSDKDGGEGHEDQDEDSEKEGSIYSSDGGFIDDSLLNEEVVEQVMASSTYGMTQIEEEARRRKNREDKVGQKGDGGALKDKSANDVTNGEYASEDDNDDDDESAVASAADSDFDDGFFVNLGDLEMAEGWSGDVVITPTKNVNKKRTYNKKTTTTSANKVAGKIAKKKMVKAKAAPPGGVKKLSKDANKKLPKDAKPGSDKAKIKKKNTSENGTGVTKKKKVAGKEDEDGGNGGSMKSPTMSKKNVKESTSSSKNKATAKMNTKSPTAFVLAATNKSSKPKPSSSPKDKPKKPVSKEKEKATQLRLIYKRRYNSCIKLIREMTNEDLPKKPKAKNTMKVSVNIPADKEIGDELTFGCV